MTEDPLPAWSLEREAALAARLRSPFPLADSREWAFAGSTGAGVRVCVIDSGVDGTHPRVGGISRAVCFETGDDGERRAVEDTEGDLYGHGTACAGIIRSLAPDCELYSVRTLGRDLTGAGAVLIAGLEWAIDEGYDIINLSLSTTKSQFVADLHALADRAYFANTLIFAAAHNMPVQSYPWRFPAVVSVGSHSGTDPHEFYANPDPPVEFLARGVNVELAWLEHSTIHATGNSFATPHVAGLAALALAKHPGLAPFELKSLLRAAAGNVRSAA
jgi:subtilisin